MCKISELSYLGGSTPFMKCYILLTHGRISACTRVTCDEIFVAHRSNFVRGELYYHLLSLDHVLGSRAVTLIWEDADHL